LTDKGLHPLLALRADSGLSVTLVPQSPAI